MVGEFSGADKKKLEATINELVCFLKNITIHQLFKTFKFFMKSMKYRNYIPKWHLILNDNKILILP